MAELTNDLNWLAVIVGAVVAFLLGWLWYSPKMFGTKWAEGVGVELDKVDAMPIAAMVTKIVGTVLLSVVIGILHASGSMAMTGLVVLTIIMLLVAAGYFAQKSNYAIATESGFIVVMTAIMIAAQIMF